VSYAGLVEQGFFSLLWYRLQITLINIRTVPSSNSHPYSVFEAILKGVNQSAGITENSFVFFHIPKRKHTFRVRQSDQVPLEILFCKCTKDFVEQWRSAFVSYLQNPSTGKNFDIVTLGDVEERNYSMVLNEYGSLPTEGEVCLEFLAPFPFKRAQGKQNTFITKEAFIKALEARFSRLFDQNIVYAGSKNSFSILPYYWNYTEIRHPSASQPGNIQYINGCVGKFYLKGDFTHLMPFLILGSELHAGTRIGNSQGYYLLHIDPPGYFSDFFPNRKAVLSTIRNVIERYDHALESLSTEEQFPFKEEEYAQQIFSEIASGSYMPSPTTAFLIKKKGGVDRMVEQLHFKDLIVQQYTLRTISHEFERILEPESIGFRKGINRQKALDTVGDSIKDGYQYLIESDIEDFFPSVDLTHLQSLLDSYIPAKDTGVRVILARSIKNGFVLRGTLQLRTKGLAQGAPLSPIMANLYLDSFDEYIKNLNVRMIRYADDFIILTKTKEEAEEVLSKTESFLHGLGLKIKKEKTAIRRIKDGFQFLGMHFDGTTSPVDMGDDFKRLKKPLYITEPYCFLSLNGEAIDIRKNKTLIETIPLRRISEIIVMDKSVVSSTLIAKCTGSGIPLTLTLQNGYYITTIKPDSKKYHDISCAHAAKYYSFSETEILSIAKEFAAAKLRNYISLFKQRYEQGLNLFIGKIERIIQNIYEAPDVPTIRGFEGFAAKEIYHRLNAFIDDEQFKIVKRERRKPDRINSLLNFGYYLLFSRINATVRAVGLNPYLGFLHNPDDSYESLVCDIEELFRSRIDRFLIKLINLKSVTGNDFVQNDAGFILQRDAIKMILNKFEGEMERKNSKNTLSLQESIYVQVCVVKNFMLDNKSLTFHQWVT